MKNNDFIDNIIDWDKFDAISDSDQRLNGVSKDSVKMEIELWEKQLKLLEPLDYAKIKKEIKGWVIEIPQTLSYQDIALTYSRLVTYKLRVSEMLAEAQSWAETSDQAIKFLVDFSQGAFAGTAVEKKANAAHVVQPFVHLKTQANRVENYLTHIHSSVVFCANQMDLLLKERQSRAKLNMKLGHDGEYALIESSEEKPIETDEEGWTTIPKKTR